jgi:hypothetical protein
MELAELHPFPKDLLDIGRYSLEEVSFNLGEFRENDEGANQDSLLIGEEGEHRSRLIRLNAGKKQVPVVAVDTTNTDLGLTKNGLLCAFRGTVVRAEGGRCSYTRHGPFLFHVTHANRQVLYDGLRQVYLGSQKREIAPPVEKMADRIRTVLERWLQHQAVLSNSGAILLWDGSLAAPAASRSTLVVSQMLREARERGNRVLALSKKTTLGLREGTIYDLIDDEYAPSLLNIDEEAREAYGARLRFLGHVYAAKLSHSSFTFRLDIDRGLPDEEAIESVQQLLVSDGLQENYPETLRLAHVLSRFSPSETIGMQRFIRECYGLRFSPPPDVREVIFGPFEGSGSSQHQGVSAP